MADEVEYFSLVNADLKRIKQFLDSKQVIINAHNVDFYTKNLWEECLSQGIRDDLQTLTMDEIAELPSKCAQWLENPGVEAIGSLQRCSSLLELFTDIRNHHLKTLPYVKRSDYYEGLGEDSVLTSFMMSPKKSYEVGVMSQAVHDLVKKAQAKKVVDLGSGKGYLSQYLSLRHGVNVIGIDSQDSNTKNAEIRNAKTLRIWHFLLKKANAQKISGQALDEATCSKQNEKHCGCSNEQNVTSLYNLFENGSISCKCVSETEKHNLSFTNETKTSVVSTSGGITGENHDDFEEDLLTNKDYNCHDQQNPEYQNKNKKLMVTGNKNDDNCQLNSKLSSRKHLQDQMETHNANDKSKGYASYQPVTKFVSTEVKIVEQLDNILQKGVSDGLVLVGLHTCGDLAPTAIKIFLNDCHVKALCLVGCCYHLLSQSSLEEKGKTEIQCCEGGGCGFPMSAYLRKENYRISRNATMVAQQAADRLATACKVPAKSIFYRAVLQVILKEKFAQDTTGMHVGRIGAKCKTYEEYVYKAFKKLKLPSDQIKPDDIKSYHKRFEQHEWKIMAFHQLRACIAPCIESLFLVDRLCYLLEQGVHDAQIEALFDPVKSPRSYAIIASKLHED